MLSEGLRFPGSLAGEFADIGFRYAFQAADLDSITDITMRKSNEEAEELSGRIVEARAAFECAKLEFYVRIVRPYEDQKLHDNGDVYEVGGAT